MGDRAVALGKLKDLFKAVHNGRYFVKRGVILWAGFDFVTHPFAVSIQVDEVAPLRPIADLSLSIEMATAIPQATQPEPEIDDLTQDELTEDCVLVLNQWERARRTDGARDPYVIKMERLGVRTIEFHDATLQVQGLILTVNVSI